MIRPLLTLLILLWAQGASAKLPVALEKGYQAAFLAVGAFFGVVLTPQVVA